MSTIRTLRIARQAACRQLAAAGRSSSFQRSLDYLLMSSTLRVLLAEALGTFILVLFGCGAVHAAVLTGAQSGLWQVAIVWGSGVAFAAYCVGGISGAHINPAITIAMATWGRFGWDKVAGHIVAQLCGAFVAAAALFMIYGPNLRAKE